MGSRVGLRLWNAMGSRSSPFFQRREVKDVLAYLKISKDLDHELRFRVPLVVADFGFAEQVSFVRIEGLDNRGAAPGFGCAAIDGQVA